jgi:hypothetical protein
LASKHIAGWWYTYPSEKYEFVSWDDEIPNIWKISWDYEIPNISGKNVPNHQPDWI